MEDALSIVRNKEQLAGAGLVTGTGSKKKGGSAMPTGAALKGNF